MSAWFAAPNRVPMPIHLPIRNSNGVHDGGEYYVETNGTAGRQAGEPFLDFDNDNSYRRTAKRLSITTAMVFITSAMRATFAPTFTR